MSKILKKLEYNGIQYEIRLITRGDGTWFLKDFKQGSPFSPYYYGIHEGVDVSRVEAMLGMPLLDYLISQAEDGVRFWVENKDKLKI
jgi:hypothetical protein